MTDSSPQAAPLAVSQLLWRMAAGTLLLTLALGVLGWGFPEQIREGGQWFVSKAGLPGLFACFYVPDTLPVPGAHEVCTGFSLMGGVPFWTVVAVAGSGSVCGGMSGYGLGRGLGHTERVQRFLRGRGANAYLLVKRHGVSAVALGAVSPLPYSVCSWAAGVLRMSPRAFVLVSLLRFPRIAFYLWLIEMGLTQG